MTGPGDKDDEDDFTIDEDERYYPHWLDEPDYEELESPIQDD